MESRPGQDDEVTFRQKVRALQRFLNHGISRFSIDTWHHALTALYRPLHPHPQHGHPVLTSLADLRALSRDVMLQREGGSLREADTQALKHVDNFLTALTCVREAKACMADLHRFLYRYYYDPATGRQQSHVQSGTALSRASSVQAAGGGGAGPSAYEVSAKQFGILTLQQMTGSTGDKLRRTVADMQHILSRWDRLMMDGEIQADDLDAESQQDLHMLSGTAAFQPVLRLLPDIFAKFYKCLELLKQWWVLAHEIYPELPINRPATPPSRDCSEQSEEETVSRLNSGSELMALNTVCLDESCEEAVSLSEHLQKTEDSIQEKENSLQALNEELQLLEERERHFESLVEAYEKVTAELEDQTREHKELVTAREQETFPPHLQMLDLSATDVLSTTTRRHNMDHLNEEVARTERQVQMLQFQQSLLRQDYLVQLELRPSLIRFADDVRLRIAQAENSLVEDKMEKIKLQTLVQEEASTSDFRSVSSPPHSDRYNEEDKPPQGNTDLGKTAEDKLELSRLLSRPLQEDKSGFSVTEQMTPAATVEGWRRQSHPIAKREEAGKKASAPTIKVHHLSQGKSVDDQSPSPQKSPRGPAGPSPQESVCPQSPRQTSVTDSRNRTEVLFQRRVRRTQENEATTKKTSIQRDSQSDKPSPRPRAQSDPHTLRTQPKALNPNPTLSRRLSERHKPEGKSHPKVNGTSSSPRPTANPNGAEEADTIFPKSKAAAVRKTSTTSSQKSKPGDVEKGVVTSYLNRMDDVRSEKVGDTKNYKETAKHLSKSRDSLTTSHSSKSSQMKENSEMTSPTPKPAKNKNDNHKTARQAGREGGSPKVPDKTPSGATSQKAAKDDVRKNSSSTTLQASRQDDKATNRTTVLGRLNQRTRPDSDGRKSGHTTADVRKEVT